MAHAQICSIREFPIPTTYKAENALLGGLIGSPENIADVRRVVNAAAFSDDANMKLWHTLCERDDRGEEVSFEALLPIVNIKHFQENILPYIVPQTISEISDKAVALSAVAAKRRAYITAVELIQKSTGDSTAADLIAALGDLFADLSAQSPAETTKRISDVFNELGEVLQKRERDIKQGKALRVPTSFPQLDFLTFGGFANGNLVILAARPSVGKTAFALQMARAAASHNIPALVFSLEMTNVELAQRMVCATGMMNAYDIARGSIDWTLFEQATGRFLDAPLYFNDNTFSLDDLVTEITKAAKRGRAGIVFIDYLGLISFKDGSKSIYQQITDATKRLKRLAKECDIPIVLLCQLNRDMSKEGRAPQLHDLRDSGSIEQDADIVLMLSRNFDVYEDGTTSREIEMYVRKNRQGRVGDCIKVTADNSFTNFYETCSTAESSYSSSRSASYVAGQLFDDSKLQ